MAKETTYAGMLGDWQRLLESLRANGEELAHLERSRTKLEALVAQAVEIRRQQAESTAVRLEATRRFEELIPEGQRLVNLLRLAVKEHYGIRSKKLAEFQVQPFSGRPRKAKPGTEEPEVPAPSPPPQTSEAAEDPQR